MSKYPRKIDRATAELLLRGEPADPRHPYDLLAVLLATAAAPAHAGELAGEEAAVAAFRQSRAAVAGLASRPGDEASIVAERSWRTAAPLRGWTRHPMRLAIVALAATTAGGVALANGSIPWSQQPADRRPATGSTTPSELAGPGSGQGQGQGGAGTATPHPSLAGLCRAYETGAGDAPGKALDNPAFTSLIKAAGGKDKVAAYCADVLAAEAKRAKKSTPSGQATTPDHLGETRRPGLPAPAPTGRATGRPTVLPSPTVPPPSKSIPSRIKAPQTRLLSA
jgi:hypothetical protein